MGVGVSVSVGVGVGEGVGVGVGVGEGALARQGDAASVLAGVKHGPGGAAACGGALARILDSGCARRRGGGVPMQRHERRYRCCAFTM